MMNDRDAKSDNLIGDRFKERSKRLWSYLKFFGEDRQSNLNDMEVEKRLPAMVGADGVKTMHERSSTKEFYSKATLLLIEEDADAAHILQFLLAREGFDLWIAPDGLQALKLISLIEPPQLILMDIVLPYFSGFELIAQIRSKPGWCNIPITILTAKSDEQDIVRALDAGVNDYVLKPFQPYELIARLKRFLRVPAAGQATLA
jgi:CheY-like chemotaxis protein